MRWLEKPLESMPSILSLGPMKSPLMMMNLLSGFYWFDEALQRALEAEGFTSVGRSQSLVLTNISAGERRAARIAENIGVTRQAISQLLAEMEAEGLIVVSPDPEDKRARIVDYSEKSKGMRQAGIKVLEACERELGARIGVSRVKAMRAALAMDWGEPPEPQAKRRPAAAKRKRA